MQQEIQYLEILLEEHHNKIKASVLHLTHQRELPEFLRVIDLTNGDIDDTIDELNTELAKVEGTRNYLKTLKPKWETDEEP